MPQLNLQQSVLTRLNAIVADMNFSTSDIAQCNTMTDKQLFGFLYEKALAQSAQISPRELKKLTQRAKAKAKFVEALEEVGGTLKAKAVATLLNVSRQTVANKCKAKGLLAVQMGTDYLYPKFQFDNNGIIDFFQQLNQALPEGISDVARVSFFINDINDGGTPLMPWQSLQQVDLDDQDQQRLLRAAHLYHQQVAR